MVWVRKKLQLYIREILNFYLPEFEVISRKKWYVVIMLTHYQQRSRSRSLDEQNFFLLEPDMEHSLKDSKFISFIILYYYTVLYSIRPKISGFGRWGPDPDPCGKNHFAKKILRKKFPKHVLKSRHRDKNCLDPEHRFIA
jgi:hypothetical protein